VLSYRLLFAPIFVLLAGCSHGPDWYAPPEQRQPLAVSQASYLASFVSMNDPNAGAHLVKDISKVVEGGAWRWAYQRPELRFYVDTADHLKFQVDFSLPDQIFVKTGPVTLSVSINGVPLGKQRFDKPGIQKLELPVPAKLVKAGAINNVVVEPDKVWSTADGGKLGFVLVAAGFQE
jgi:hypothetical protein